MSFRLRSWNWLLLAPALIAFTIAGCSNDDTTGPSSNNDVRISRVEVDQPTLAPGESAELRVWVVRGADPGTPVEGVQVRFAELLSNGSGAFSKEEELSDAQGRVTSVFTPTVAEGQVTLKVSAGDDVEYVTLQVTTAPSNGVNIAMSTSSSATSLPADGTSTLQVTITVTRGDPAVAMANTTVLLTSGDQFLDIDGDGRYTGADQLMPAGDLNGDGLWNAEGTVPEEVTTDTNGRATFLYVSGRNQGNVYVKATAAGASRDLELFQHPTSLQVRVVANERELLANGVNGTDILATVSDWNGAPIDGVIVRFVAGEPFTDVDVDGYYTPGVDSFEDSNSNGQWDAVGTIASTATTNLQGEANAFYTAGLREGPVSIQATSSSGGAATVVQLVRVPPATRVTFDESMPSLLPADGLSVAHGEIEVRDVSGQLIAGKQLSLVAGERFDDVDNDGVFTQGTDVLIEDLDSNGTWSSIGDIQNEVFSNEFGVASFAYVAGSTPGTIWIRAATDGVSVERAVELQDLPTAWDLQLESSAPRLSVNGSGGVDNAVLTAWAFDTQGEPVPAGVPVNFRIVSGPGGGEVIQGASAGVYTTMTNGDGRATAVVTAGTTPGLITVESASGTTVRRLDLPVGAGPAAVVTGRTLTQQIEFWSSTEIEAVVQDAFGNPVEDGTVVVFSVDEGLIQSEFGPGLSQTTNGTAVASYESLGQTAETDYVATVTARVQGTEVSDSFDIGLISTDDPESGDVYRIALTAELPEIGVEGTGATEQTNVIAQGLDENGNPVDGGHAITFSIIEGPGGGEHFLSGTGPVTVTTDGDGKASVTLASGIVSGSIVVRAEGGEGISNHTTVAVAAGPPAYIDVGVEECNVLACRRVNVENAVVAVVSDIYHNPVRDGTVVYFTTDKGVVHGNVGLGTGITENGVTSGTWRSSDSCEFVTITASTAGGPVADNVVFIASDDPAQVEILSPSSDTVSLLADGDSEQVIWVEVLDANGMFVLPAELSIESDFGAVTIEESGDGCASSVARATYTTNTLDRDYSVTTPDDGLGAVDQVLVSTGFGGGSDGLTVNLLTSGAYRDNSSVELGGSVGPGGSVAFAVSIADRFGNPLGGHTLEASVSAGSVSALSPTDTWGQSGGTFFAPLTEGPVSLTIVDTDPGYGGMVISAVITVQP